MRGFGFRGTSVRFEFSPTQLAFAAFGFVASDGFTGFESHQKPPEAIKSRSAGFLMQDVSGPLSIESFRVCAPRKVAR